MEELVLVMFCCGFVVGSLTIAVVAIEYIKKWKKKFFNHYGPRNSNTDRN